MLTTLVEPAELAAHLIDADWAVVDCRFDLADTGWGERAYGAGHIRLSYAASIANLEEAARRIAQYVGTAAVVG